MGQGLVCLFRYTVYTKFRKTPEGFPKVTDAPELVRNALKPCLEADFGTVRVISLGQAVFACSRLAAGYSIQI
jgi:hypothetical protein